MATPFDPNGAVRFDLRTGAASDARGARLVLVPSEALASLGPELEQVVARRLVEVRGILEALCRTLLQIGAAKPPEASRVA